jgi:hypothetical protein
VNDGTSHIWEQVCQHIDGLAVGSTVAALADRGVLSVLADSPVSVAGLAARTGANPGFLRVGLRLLAHQGWLRAQPVREAEPVREAGTGSAADDFTVAPTACGRAVMSGLAEGYRLATAFLPALERVAEILSGTAGDAGLRTLTQARELMRSEWRLPSDAVPVYARHQVLCHLDGHVVAPVMAALIASGGIRPEPGMELDAARWDGDDEAFRLAIDILVSMGWAATEGPGARLTPAGAVATTFARQYWHPVSYLPTLRQVPELLFGDPGRLWAAPPGEEIHLDRGLDIQFSGDVFSGTCREPLLDVARPVFDRMPLEAQPSAIVDAGCGDGRMLETLYTAIRTTTERGRRLSECPLLVIGVEPSAVARRVASARLAAAGIPHAVIDGDIAEPDVMGKNLARLGIDPADALHVSKSVIHDRSRCLVRGTLPATAGSPPPVAFPAFATRDGAAIPAAEVAVSLAELLHEWRPLAYRHGLLVVEAHTVSPQVASPLVGRTLATELDATHGYSCQYPVEPHVFAWAARAAGWRSLQHREPGRDVVGHTILTIDHFAAELLLPFLRGPARKRYSRLRAGPRDLTR